MLDRNTVVSTGIFEDLIRELKSDYPVLTVTHNLQQVSWISGYTAFMYFGRIMGYGTTAYLFTNPHLPETNANVTD